jgi:hypothetical protein
MSMTQFPEAFFSPISFFPSPLAERGDMGKAEQYRHYAAECIRLAQQSRGPTEKDSLVQMAEAWRRLAEHVETTGERQSDGETG